MLCHVCVGTEGGIPQFFLLPVARVADPMVRVRRIALNCRAKGPRVDAAWPGPPASSTSGSGEGESVLAGSTATKIDSRRPCGRRRSSGTSSVPHCTACATFGRRHSMSAMRRVPAARSPHPAMHIASATIARRRETEDRERSDRGIDVMGRVIRSSAHRGVRYRSSMCAHCFDYASSADHG